MAAPAISGLRNPAAASGIAAMLYPNAQARLPRITASVPRASRIASGTAPRSSRSTMQVRGADSDVSAGAQGDAEVGRGQRGAVIDPVADHGHPVALGLQIPDHRYLLAGSAPAITSSVPARAPTARAVAWLSPVSSTVRRPRRRSSVTAPRRSA